MLASPVFFASVAAHGMPSVGYGASGLVRGRHRQAASRSCTRPFGIASVTRRKNFCRRRLGPEGTICYSKAKVFVMGRYADPTEKAIRCPLKGHQRPLLACLACRHFPCRAMTEERLALLRTSPFVQLDTKNSKLLPRRHVMYIFRMTSGELRDAPEDFSPDAPDFEQLADVEEVLVIGKVLVKQLRLVAKPREERDRIREQLSTPDLPEEMEEEKPRRRRRSSVRDED